MSKLYEAVKFAVMAHEGQLDKGGRPYILHPVYLALQQTSETAKIAALLHDTVEDYGAPIKTIRRYFGGEVATIVEILTHDNTFEYMDYIKSIKESGNECAISIKIADLKHNSDLSRLSEVTEKDEVRVEKYKAALAILEGKGDKRGKHHYTCRYSDNRQVVSYYTNAQRMFYNLSKIYSFNDCNDIVVVTEIVYDNEPVYFVGWQPGMLCEYVEGNHKTIYSQSFPEWDH